MLNKYNYSGYNFCIIIPTLNRNIELIQTLKSICSSSIKPKRIIIVDDGNIENTQKNLNEVITLNPNIQFVLVLGNSTGLTNARNIGIKYIDSSEIVFFLDDDVTLNNDYFEKILMTFDNDQEIIGCQGFISNTINRNIFSRFIIGLIGVIIPIKRSFFTPDVTRSLVNRYPLFVPLFKKVRYCQWLSGCNMAYRSEILNEFKFDENLITASIGEDFDFSYNIHNNGFNLAINFDARLIHRMSNEYRRPKKNVMMMELGYQFYYIHKYVSNQKYAHLLCIYYSFFWLLCLIFNSLIQIRLDVLKDGLYVYQYTTKFEYCLAAGNIHKLNIAIKNNSFSCDDISCE